MSEPEPQMLLQGSNGDNDTDLNHKIFALVAV